LAILQCALAGAQKALDKAILQALPVSRRMRLVGKTSPGTNAIDGYAKNN
jgi:hypothetical protein